MNYENLTLRAINLKCIGAEPEGFDAILPINVIVGRNNSGKSSLIDLVELAVRGNAKVDDSGRHGGKTPEVLLSNIVQEADIPKAFERSHSGGDFVGNHFDAGSRLVGSRLTCALREGNARAYLKIESLNGREAEVVDVAARAPAKMDVLASQPQHNPFLNKSFRRLAAERNIQPEVDQQHASISGNGGGATNVVQQFLNKAHLPRELVQVTLRDALNQIFRPDTEFEDIICRQHQDGRWEVFLRERTKGFIALSQSGSGLKTVILALCFLHLIPVLDQKPLSAYVMAFEELENNLHPALQRRLLSYLARQAIEHNFPIFLTTHSNVAIDLLNKNPLAQIIHVTHDGTKSTAKVVRAFIDGSGVLDDLDVRASDLLQSNGVIWVEGPSDRTYLNRWISLWSYGELAEGNHYQSVFYGGRLLAHLSADSEDINDAVSILRVNRNAAVVIDSDRRHAADLINATKTRLVEELEAIGGIAWVTTGREIENYLPIEVLRKWHPDLKAIKGPTSAFGNLFEYLEKKQKGLGSKYEKKKPLLAEELGLHTTREDLASVPDLAASLELLCSTIRKWNRLPEPSPV